MCMWRKKLNEKEKNKAGSELNKTVPIFKQNENISFYFWIEEQWTSSM